jgi:predicted  nucleic acid-binding Zn-ribbon protein
MTSQNPFKQFLSLVAFDNALQDLQETVKQFQEKKQALQEKKEELARMVEQLKQQEHNVRKEVDMHELHMKELDQKEQSKKHLLDDINTPKEYTIAKREIEAIKREQHEHEQTLMQVWHTLESVHKSFETKKQELDSALAQFDNEIAALDEKERQVQTEYNQKMAERAQHTVGIPEEWLEKYRAMQSRVKDPVVPVQQGSCSACFTDIPEQRLLQLKRHALLQCEGCYRFLYMPDVLQSEQSPVNKDS